MQQSTLIAVIGGSVCTPEAAAAAEAVGRHLALRGATVVCGGLGGVMEAVCKGAREAGGHTIGLLPAADAAEANPYVEFPLPTGLGHARNAIVARSAQAVIAIDGSYGTLSEMAFALVFETPVIGLSTWELALHGQSDTSVIRATSPQDAVEKALAAAAAR
jgi:uncharacterized protein (TIGR00725 family)